MYAFSSNFWQSRYTFSGADGGTAVVFHKGGVLRTTVTVEIAAEALRGEALPLLVALGMVAILLHHQERGGGIGGDG